MNIYITGIGPMLACAKGAEGLQQFNPQQLWILTDDGSEHKTWFDPKTDLSGRGFKYFNAATCYLIAAIRQFDATIEDENTTQAAIRKGIIIGSNSCTRLELNEMDQAILEQGYNGIHPMRAPSFCANVGTGTVSIKQQAKAFNITLTNPLTAGLESIILGKYALLDGRASYAITGAMEDDSEYTLGPQQYHVQTTGGAWSLGLESDDHKNTPLACIGETLNRFIPDLPFSPEETALLIQSLEQDLAPFLSGLQKPEISVVMLMDPHSQLILGLLKNVFSRFQIKESRIGIPVKDTKYNTLHPLAQLSWLALNTARGICIAISPLGHLTAVEVYQPSL